MTKHRAKVYLDEHKYWRYSDSGRLVHRARAYKIYRESREQYPLRFSDYQVHHKNKNKRDNRYDNLELVTRPDHAKIHWKDPHSRMAKVTGGLALIAVIFQLWVIGLVFLTGCAYYLYKRGGFR